MMMAARSGWWRRRGCQAGRGHRVQRDPRAGFDAAKKVNIIKPSAKSPAWSLMDCKATVEGAPKAVKENADKKTADDLKKKLEEAGAKVSVKPAG